jgi:spore coat protein H
MKDYKIFRVLLTLVFLIALFTGCDTGSQNETEIGMENTKIADNKKVYAKDNDGLENVYVTIVTDNTSNMNEVDAWNLESTYTRPEINVRFDYGTPATDTTGVNANAVLSQRGNSASIAILKSYKIKLSDGAAKLKGQKTLNLNKHPYDMTVIRNKVCLDLIKMFDNTFSFRTQFCHLYVRDLNSSNKEYQDYGLFTHVEEPGKNYLKARGISENSYMYKAKEFDFTTNSDIVWDINDPGYNKAEFEDILDIQGVEDHSRLIKMLAAVNDESQDINDVIAKYFDRDNYITWIAMNLLLSNTDTYVSNFILMSPADQEKWYFIPWDYDDALCKAYQPGVDNSWMAPYMLDGIAMYWKIPLHRRFLEDPKNLADVTAKIEELSLIANRQVLKEKIDRCYAATNILVKSMPDLAIMKKEDTSIEEYESEIVRLYSAIDEGKRIYYKGLEKPMPFELKDVLQEDEKFTFIWGKSVDFAGEKLYYDFTLSSSADFSDVLFKKLNIEDTSLSIDPLDLGTYYWKVEVVDASGNRQISYSGYYDEIEGKDYYGINQLLVEE